MRSLLWPSTLGPHRSRLPHRLGRGSPAALAAGLMVLAAGLVVAATIVFTLLPATADAAASPGLTSVGSWTITLTQPTAAVTSVVADAGKVVWGEFSVAGPNSFAVTSHIKLYDSASNQVTTLLTTPTEVMFCQLHGDHLLYGLLHSAPDDAPSDLILRSLASGDTKKLNTEGWDPHYSLLTANAVVWDEMLWTSNGDRLPRNVKLYDIATGTMSDIAQMTSEDEYYALLSADDAWVVWAYSSTSDGPRKVWAYSIKTKQKVELPGLAATDVMVLTGDTIYHVSQLDGGYELRAYDLATGQDSVVVSRPLEIQSIAVDGDHFAWTEWDGGPVVVYFDHSTRRLVRIASPAYTVGSLTLKGDMLVWKGDIDHFQYTHGSNHQLFAFDVAKGTVTRLSAIQSQAFYWATDGQLVAADFALDRVPGQSEYQLAVFKSSEAAGAGAFADVAGTDPYWTAISGLKDLGAVEGYPVADGVHAYGPDSSLTRDQFAKILVEALHVPLSGDYVSTLAKLGILQGTARGGLLPYATLTRAQMVSLVVRAADKLRPGMLPQSDVNDYPGVIGTFDSAHAGDVARAQWGGLLVGLVGYAKGWDPWHAATRGEAAQVLWNLASWQK